MTDSTSDTDKINRAAQPLHPLQSSDAHKSAIQAEQDRLQKALARRMAEHTSTSSTNRLAGRTLDSGRNGWLPNLSRSGGAGDYPLLPTHLAPKVDLSTCPRWRVELHGMGGGTIPIGFDLVGDVVLGRGKDGPSAPDVDLEHFSAQRMGVSRRHVILRPTEKHLYLIDLNSTNGTMHNGLPVGPGVARSIQHNDTIMLGDLTFTMKIVARPGVPVQPLTPPITAYAEIVKQEAARREALSAQGSQPNATVQMQPISRQSTPRSQTEIPTPNPVEARAAAPIAQPDPPKPQPTPAKPAAKIMGLRSHLIGKK